MLGLVAAAIPILLALAVRIWPHTPIGRRIVLKPPQVADASGKEEETMRKFIGRVVVSEYPMMPANQLTIDHQTFNAIAETSFIEAGQTVEVVSVRQRQLVVRSTDRSPESHPSNTPNRPLAGANDLLSLPADELGLDSLE
jgi:membrane-bound ClpP family serine protease